MSELNRSTILLTGGTGSFGKAFISFLLAKKDFKGVIRVFSRDEFKQYQLQREYPNHPGLRYFIGDVRDLERLRRAMQGADIVIHAAALKQIETAEYNPFEVVKTNIVGSQNVVEAAIDTKVKKAILIGSDKAVNPISLYGATKLAAERIFIQGNVYSGRLGSLFSVARFGNLLGSRGSVTPLFSKQKATGVLTITHKDMTRFWITPRQASEFVWNSIQTMRGGEIFVPKLPSVKITDLAKAVAPNAKIKITGLRQSEKLYEEMIANEESTNCLEHPDFYTVFSLPANMAPYYPKKLLGKIGHHPFSYRSDTNSRFLTIKDIRQDLKKCNL